MVKKSVTYVVLALAAIVSLFPFYFMFVSGTALNTEVLASPPRLFFGASLMDNLSILMDKIDIWRVMFNSLFVSVLYTLLALLMYSAAGYALGKFNFKGKNIVFTFIMISMMLPSQVMYVPLFRLMISLNMTDTHTAVILPMLANAFGIFLMRQNMMSFPTPLIEAARIDGCRELTIFFRVVLPNMRSALGALAIYMFTSMWNNFMWPLIILGNEQKYTFPVALAMLNGNPTNKDYAVLMLATSIATLPILIIFLIFQKQFVAGVMGGAIKE